MKGIILSIFFIISSAYALSNCFQPCTMQYDPVCGTDGQTYSNECGLNIRACLTRAPLQVAFQGRCGSASPDCGIRCPRLYRPVCGTDGNTYNNECLLNQYNCNSQTQVQVASTGRCDSEPTGNFRRQNIDRGMDCPLVCTMQFDPQCGSNGVTYSNMCTLRAAACQSKGERITVVKSGKC